MNVTGIIAEYNPFHNGHKYQLDELRRRTNADHLIIAMSGDFVQRGVPAVFDKYTRTKMALAAGADLVLEIPVLWATASAEYFALAGVSLLGATGVVKTLGYGVESKEPTVIKQLAKALSAMPDAYDHEIMTLQKKGLSFPAAREAALAALLPEAFPGDLSSFLSLPNNILAVEYEKALAKRNSTLSPEISSYALPRIGDGYHEKEVKSRYASATAVRRMLLAGEDVSGYVPASTLALLSGEEEGFFPVSGKELSLALYYRLLLLQREGYERFADCSHDLSCKISNHLKDFQDFEQFAMLLKSKDLTYTRICRVLIHILLDITKEDYLTYQGASMVPYLRVLGFKKEAKPLLSAIKKKASSPLITKVADASNVLLKNELLLLQKDIFASDLYRGIAKDRAKTEKKNEFTQGVIIR